MNMANVKITDLKKKIIIFSSSGYQGSNLKTYINATWSGNNANIVRLHYSELFTKIDIRSQGSPVRYRGGEITYPEFISYLPKKTIDNILKIQDSDKFKPMSDPTNINVLKDIIFNCTKIEPSTRYNVLTIIAKFKELPIIQSLKLD